MEIFTEVCTCDDNCDEPCPRHQRENELQDRVIELENREMRLIEVLSAHECWCYEEGFTSNCFYCVISDVMATEELDGGYIHKDKIRKRLQELMDGFAPCVGDKIGPGWAKAEERRRIQYIAELFGVELKEVTEKADGSQ